MALFENTKTKRTKVKNSKQKRSRDYNEPKASSSYRQTMSHRSKDKSIGDRLVVTQGGAGEVQEGENKIISFMMAIIAILAIYLFFDSDPILIGI